MQRKQILNWARTPNIESNCRAVFGGGELTGLKIAKMGRKLVRNAPRGEKSNRESERGRIFTVVYGRSPSVNLRFEIFLRALRSGETKTDGYDRSDLAISPE